MHRSLSFSYFFKETISKVTIYYYAKLFISKNFILANSLALIAGILVLIPNALTLLTGRLVQGVCIGILGSITPLTIKELMPI